MTEPYDVNNGEQNAGSRPPVNPAGASTPPAPPAGFNQVYMAPPEGKSGGVMNRVATGLISSILLLSIFLNVYFGGMYLALVRGGPSESVYEDGDETQRIVILKVSGTISDSTRKFVAASLKALKKNKPKAIVLRVNSPGGGLGASDQIDRAIKEFKKDTGVPVVVSFGNVAASGGYYISAGADHIVSEPTTITGSIGVIAQGFTFEKTLEKIGVTPETIIADGSTKKDVLDVTRAWTDRDRQVLKKFLDDGYVRFRNIVKEGRGKKITEEQLDQAATGEPFSTQEAIRLGLVDSEGYVDDAIAEAKKLAKADKAMVTVISPPVSLLNSVLSSKGEMPSLNSITPDQARAWINELSMPKLEYRWVPIR